MKKFNLGLIIFFGFLMIWGILSLLFGNTPEKAWATDDYKLIHLILTVKSAGISIVGAIGFFTELLYFNLILKKDR